jgi:hypothetical protein
MLKMKIVCLCLGLALISCKNRELRRELEEFVAKEIVVHDGMWQIVGGQDSIFMNQTAEVTRLIVWVDSLGCSTCRINKMFEYAEMVDYCKEIDNGFVPLFVFSPPHSMIGDVIYAMKFNEFDYPIIIDEKQAFPAANPHIPADSRFHTFLIDKNGKVVLVGDPVNNPALWELYKTTITTLIENNGVMPEVKK